MNPTECGGIASHEDVETTLPNLLYTLSNPMSSGSNVVAVTTDSAHPVLNTLEFHVLNPWGKPIVTFNNPDGKYKPGNAPGIHAAAPGFDRIYVYFPWGSTRGTLTTSELSNAITLSVGSENTTWFVQQLDDPTIGVYWILFPQDKAVLHANESVSFVFTGIKTLNPTSSLTSLQVEARISGYDPAVNHNTALQLEDLPPTIQTFHAASSSINAGDSTTLSWTTWNATSCALTPGAKSNLDANVAKYPIQPLASANYVLVATGPSGKAAQQIQSVELNPAKIKAFTDSPAQNVRVEEPVTLSWDLESVVRATISPDVGVLFSNASRQQGSVTVHPEKRTVYTLTVYGGSTSDVEESTTLVFPVSRGWSRAGTSGSWQGVLKPLMFTLKDRLFLLNCDAFTDHGAIYASDDGSSWQVQGQSPWTSRTGGSGLAHSDAAWMFGGKETSSGTLQDDVWKSTDGETWTRATDKPGWKARADAGAAFFQGKMWVIGGQAADGVGLSDVWSSVDGVTWVQETANAAWSGRWGFGLAILNDKLWLIGGCKEQYISYSNEVWYSDDGKEWTQAPTPPWSGRQDPAVEVLGDTLYLYGGFIAQQSGNSGAVNAFPDFFSMRAQTPPGKPVQTHWMTQAGPGHQHTALGAALGSTPLVGAIWYAGGFTVDGPNALPFTQTWTYAPSSTTLRAETLLMTDNNQYDDILVRTAKDEHGYIPRSGYYLGSPDVIPFGDMGVLDPQGLFGTQEAYDGSDPNASHKHIIAGQTNQIFMRGKNLSQGQESGRAYLYYARRADLNTPNAWYNNQLTTRSGAPFVKVQANERGDIVVIDEPFEWRPTDHGNTPYVLIGVVGTANNPNPVESLKQSDDLLQSNFNFEKWIDKRAGVGAGLFTTQPAPSVHPTFSATAAFDLHNTENTIQFEVQGKNLPRGAVIAFKASTPDVNGSIIQMSAVTVDDDGTINQAVPSTVPRNFKTDVSFTYSAQGSAPPAGATLTIIAGQTVGGSSGGGGFGPTRFDELVSYTVSFG